MQQNPFLLLTILKRWEKQSKKSFSELAKSIKFAKQYLQR